MKFLPAQFPWISRKIMSSKQFCPQRLFNLTDYREVIVKTFTAHHACRSANLNWKLVSATTNGFIFQIIY